MITTTQDSRDLALVTSASSGIGAAIADVLARRGTHLVVCARSEDALKAHAERWRACGVSVETVAADLTRLEDLEAVWAAALETARVRGLALTTVVNNAGFGAFGPDERIDEERLASMLRLNAEALMRLTHRAVSHVNYPSLKGEA